MKVLSQDSLWVHTWVHCHRAIFCDCDSEMSTHPWAIASDFSLDVGCDSLLRLQNRWRLRWSSVGSPCRNSLRVRLATAKPLAIALAMPGYTQVHTWMPLLCLTLWVFLILATLGSMWLKCSADGGLSGTGWMAKICLCFFWGGHCLWGRKHIPFELLGLHHTIWGCIYQELIHVIISPPTTPNKFWGFSKRNCQENYTTLSCPY